MSATERSARAFGQMAAKNDEGPGLDEAGGEERRPIVVPVVGVDDAGPGAAEKACQGKDLQRAEFRQGAQGRGDRGQRRGLRTGGFQLPALIGQAPGQGETLGVGAAAAEARIQHDDAGREGGRGHVVSLR